MAWHTPITWAASQVVTFTQLNDNIRDNMNLTPAALATVSGSLFVGAGTNVIAERIPAENIVEASESTTSTTFTNLTTNGPLVTVTTGTTAMVWINVQLENTTAGVGSRASFEISGATTSAATDGRGVVVQLPASNSIGICRCTLMAVTPGSNTFRMQYRVVANTGTFTSRRIQVFPL